MNPRRFQKLLKMKAGLMLCKKNCCSFCYFCLFPISTRNPRTSSIILKALLEDKVGYKAMQEELMQFKIQKLWVLVDLPYGKRLSVHSGHEERIVLAEVLHPVAKLKAIRIFVKPLPHIWALSLSDGI
ncbi:hypothetical protein Tco_0540351 [Tanacetum coccineum]